MYTPLIHCSGSAIPVYTVDRLENRRSCGWQLVGIPLDCNVGSCVVEAQKQNQA